MNSCSVVMVSYHTGPVLFASVKSVLRQRQLAKLIVVDNGNPPDVVARLQQMALSQPRLKIINSGGNVGFARGCNLGAKQATGEFFLLLNPDCLLPPDALIHMMEAFDEMPEAMLAGCWLQNPDGSEQRGGRRNLLTPKTALSEVFGLHRLSKKMPRLNMSATPMPPHTHEVPAISGAFMCIRKRDYEMLGGMDEDFFLHVEDLDLCVRVHKAGGKIICVPSVKVTHMLPTSGESPSRRVQWQKARGFMRYFKKHFKGHMFPGLLWLVYAGIAARFAVKLAAHHFWSWLAPDAIVPHSPAVKRFMVLASGLTELSETTAFHGKTVLVTGATSHVGLCVVRRLIASGAGVLAVSRSPEVPFRHENLRWIKGDLTDGGLHLHGYLVDMAVHCAPLWHLPPVIDLLADAEVGRIVAFGSTSRFSKALSGNAYEKDIVARHTRAEAEIAARCAGQNIDWTVLRPTMIYGVGLDLNITSLAKFINRLRFFPLYPPATGRRQPVHADDLALAVLQAMNNKATFGKAYNVSGGEIVTYRHMIERLFFLSNIPTRIVETRLLPPLLDLAGKLLRKQHLNGEIARRMNDDLVFFHDDARRDFGFNPRPFLSGGIKDIEGF